MERYVKTLVVMYFLEVLFRLYILSTGTIPVRTMGDYALSTAIMIVFLCWGLVTLK